jgi:hypothetical protein
MASDTNNQFQGEARKENGQLTPEPSVEPERLKSNGPSAQSSSDVNTNADSAGQSNPVKSEPKESEPRSSATGDVTQTATPSVEPEHLKSNGPSAQPSSDVNTSADSAGQSNPVKSESKESEPGSSATGDVTQTATPTNGSSRTGHPTINAGQTEGAATGNSQPPTEVRDLQAREIDRIMRADPQFDFKILGLAGLVSNDKAEAQYQELVGLLRNCGLPKASEAIKSRLLNGRPYKACG